MLFMYDQQKAKHASWLPRQGPLWRPVADTACH